MDWLLTAELTCACALIFTMGVILGWNGHRDREKFDAELRKLQPLQPFKRRGQQLQPAPEPEPERGTGRHRGPDAAPEPEEEPV